MMQPIVQKCLLSKLTCVACAVGALSIGCSQSTVHDSVTQLAPKQQVVSEVANESTQRIEVESESLVAQSSVKPHVVRKEVAQEITANIPEVILSTAHSAMCRVRVGDEMPEIELPQLGHDEVTLSELSGDQATVVLFWKPDRWMSHMALSDLEREVVSSAESEKVAVIGIAVETPEDQVAAEAKSSGASFPQLLDVDGKAFDQLGMVMLPRIYVLDPAGRIVWFDIEYSESTRRELHETLDALKGTN
ncbi:TlpA family protein disulfide reductase [Bythopirellula goksoeyrii]|uniref:Thiol-disulfide oxidoreductase n=1 Tax=Bythopirellula goksoeyrii TaxID=1400387 RepID=A0A5B9Q5Q9_9BACT|nr:redoxin domain-containing protein [Bythopirellula goksoeyrii]QEG34394.1 thiol-disulfide oxidoreductase [Bythopirellula goksoeyrii]